nr:hypothetical protein BdHM001_34830 [Bdellovibrio sp. HM001]
MKAVVAVYFAIVSLMGLMGAASHRSSPTTVQALPNGTCIQNKWAPEITYAVSGMSDSRYQLTLISGGRPVSMLMGFPVHASMYFIEQMFKEIPCNWAADATEMEVGDDFFDWYGSFQMYSAKMF